MQRNTETLHYDRFGLDEAFVEVRLADTTCLDA